MIFAKFLLFLESLDTNDCESGDLNEILSNIFLMILCSSILKITFIDLGNVRQLQLCFCTFKDKRTSTSQIFTILSSLLSAMRKGAEHARWCDRGKVISLPVESHGSRMTVDGNSNRWCLYWLKNRKTAILPLNFEEPFSPTAVDSNQE